MLLQNRHELFERLTQIGVADLTAGVGDHCDSLLVRFHHGLGERRVELRPLSLLQLLHHHLLLLHLLFVGWCFRLRLWDAVEALPLRKLRYELISLLVVANQQLSITLDVRVRTFLLGQLTDLDLHLICLVQLGNHLLISRRECLGRRPRDEARTSSSERYGQTSFHHPTSRVEARRVA